MLWDGPWQGWLCEDQHELEVTPQEPGPRALSPAPGASRGQHEGRGAGIRLANTCPVSSAGVGVSSPPPRPAWPLSEGQPHLLCWPMGTRSGQARGGPGGHLASPSRGLGPSEAGQCCPALPSLCPAAQSHVTHVMLNACVSVCLGTFLPGVFAVDESLSLVRLLATPWTACPPSLSFTPVLLSLPLLRAELRVASVAGPAPLPRGSQPVGTRLVAGDFLSLMETPSHQPLQVGPGLGRLVATPASWGHQRFSEQAWQWAEGWGACGVCPRHPGQADLAADSRLPVLGRGWVVR